MENSIFIDGSFDPDWYESKINPIRCPTHKKKNMSYVENINRGIELTEKGEKQTQCPKCKLWFFPNDI